MDTITERAKAHREFCCNNGGRYNDYSYYLGATEQREMDIKNMQMWYCTNCCDENGETCHYCHTKERIRKAIEEESI